MRISKKGRAALGIAGVAATATAMAMIGSAPAHAENNVLGADSDTAIRGSYIVGLNDSISATKADNDLASEYGAQIRKEFKAMNAFSVKMTAEEAQEMAGDSSVAYVQQSQTYTVAGTQDNPPSWGLDRVDQETAEGDSAYNYPDTAGEGVTAYVIDTGVDYENADFDGRASSGIDTVDGDDDAMDEHGHGTHVAGTIAGTEYGLAKSASVVAVRVLDANGSGTTEGVVDGINWVAENAAENSVANMSLGGGKDQALDDAVTAAIEAGVTFGVAAGNETSDACEGSPSGTPDAITVGASDNADAFAYFSNFGSCVDIIAPGVDIVSDAPGGGEATMSGTSMATPHVVGVAALYLGENPGAAPADVATALTDGALADVVTDVPDGTTNLLLNTGFLLDGGEEEF